LKERIIDILNEYSSLHTFPAFQVEDRLDPVVSPDRNFDDLRIPPDHVSRSKSDTYYLSETELLWTHTSAHQTSLIAKDVESFLVVGDVYRRDEIDRSHYPVFHQMEGVRLFQDPTTSLSTIEADLKAILEYLARGLFGDVKMRWNEDYFPFTEPSYELEIFFQGDWLEVLGCGVIHPEIFTHAQKRKEEDLQASGSSELMFEKGWAFGLGLERLAMILFSIPDIRLFWTDDDRFKRQFKAGQISVFEPYSKYPPCTKDISFWVNEKETEHDEDGEGGENKKQKQPFTPNDFFDMVRERGGDWVEEIKLVDSFVHPKTGRSSLCYRLSYRSMDRNLTNEEVDALQEGVRQGMEEHFEVELR
jgi:phenylalanyl-tRNA synthetase alpha chain